MNRLSGAVLRGSTMAETAIVLSVFLMMLLGTTEIIFAGYYQTELDAATFFYSHEYALTNVTQDAAFTAVFPQVPSSAVTTAPLPPPNTEANDPNGVAVLKEYTTGGTPSGVYSQLTKRYGGASIILPQLVTTSASIPLPNLDLNPLGVHNWPTSVTINSGNIDGRAMVAGHDDDAPGITYSSAQANSSLELPIAAGGYDQNVPPYYITHAYMNVCTSWSGGGSSHTTCGTQHLIALGIAAYLQDASYSGAGNGNFQIATQGLAVGAQFAALASHQQQYVAWANGLPTTLPAHPSAIPSPTSTGWDWDTTANPCGGNDYGTQCPLHPLVTGP